MVVECAALGEVGGVGPHDQPLAAALPQAIEKATAAVRAVQHTGHVQRDVGAEVGEVSSEVRKGDALEVAEVAAAGGSADPVMKGEVARFGLADDFVGQ